MTATDQIDCGICLLRPWREDDVAILPAIANDWQIARYMGDGFPYPYLKRDAQYWIDVQRNTTDPTHFAIEIAGVLAGGVGYDRFVGEKRRTAHIGYWLAPSFWGRGIATAACRMLTARAFERHDLLRLETTVYAPNRASARVLEKCGYVREGVLRNAVVKRNAIMDAYLYAKVRE